MKCKLEKDVRKRSRQKKEGENAREGEREWEATREMYWIEGKVAFKRSDEKGMNDAGGKEGESSDG